MNMRIHHIGYLVKKMEKAAAEFEKLGYVVTQETVSDDYRKVDICFMEKDGYLIELVCPKSKDSVVYEYLVKRGSSPYHICYETDAFEEDLNSLLDRRYVICSERHEAPALGGRDVCFLIHPYLGMIELLESEGS